MTSFQHLQVDRTHPWVTRITLNRPQVHNALDQTLIAELSRVFAEVAADPQVRVAVLAAEGKTFCAGADLRWMQAMATFTWFENMADARGLADMLWAIDSCPVPVLGRVHGDCHGGGVGLAAVCDVVVSAQQAQFCLSEARLGLLPATISPYVVRALGERASRRYFVTAERFSAQRALALGLVHEVCEAEALDSCIEALVAAIVDNGPMAVRGCKTLARDVAGLPLDAALREDTARLIADARSSDEGREGVASFLEKRLPSWRFRACAGLSATETP